MSQQITLQNPFTRKFLQQNPAGLTEGETVIFPYKNGAYRLVQDDNYTQNFGYQWNKFADIQIDREQKTY